ncbi:SDR family oxidoreductase [Xanthovirga aplysinae]|uniref:SDR family oxidoreductase n=1 Tax=Xanthovirga aplysinae TaxID=2529853 RepID=UPI0012BBDCCE|nr:SDR family oxidoreductase [Xanthovirga aplysinae]
MNKIALVTGASSGIGEAIAKHLLTSGFKVYGTSRSQRESKPNEIQFLQMDVTEETSVRQAVEEINTKEGRIDVLVNSAGLGIIFALEDVPIEDVKKVFETNVYGALKVCKAVMPIMRAQRSGHIINISSIAGEVGLPFRGIYSASKFALEGITEAMRMELMPFGVKASILQPGDFNTNIGQNRVEPNQNKNSPYSKYLQVSNALIEKGMQKAPTPEVIGPLVEKIINTANPKERYRVGAFLETITPVLKKYLPYKVYEKLIMNHYKIK